MASIFKRLFQRHTPPPAFDMEKAVGKFLLGMPQCTAKVLVASPSYGDEHYKCDVIVDAHDLTPWAVHHAEAVWSSASEEQAARKALPIWLRGADLHDFEPSLIPPPFVAVLRPYVLDFLQKDMVDALCRECGRAYRTFATRKLDERTSGAWTWWTDEWHCPNGHLLYRQQHEINFHR